MISEIARRAPATSPGFLNSAMPTCFSAPEIVIANRNLLRLFRQGRDAQAIVEERIAGGRDAQLHVIAHGVADFDQAVGQAVAQSVAVEQRHHHVDVGLELDQALAIVSDRPFADAVELHAVMLLEGRRQREKVI